MQEKGTTRFGKEAAILRARKIQIVLDTKSAYCYML